MAEKILTFPQNLELKPGEPLEFNEMVRCNRRATRRTFKGTLNSEPVYIKHYCGLLGILRGLRTSRAASRLRAVAPELTPVLRFRGRGFGGFVLIYQAVPQAVTLDWLRQPPDQKIALVTVLRLVHLLADLHGRKVIQKDTNMTNFIGAGSRLLVLDDEDITVSRRRLPVRTSLRNLAAALARLTWLEPQVLDQCLTAYCQKRWQRPATAAEIGFFYSQIQTERSHRLRKHTGR